MVDYFTSTPAMINGRQVFAQYSNHGELRTDPANRSNQQAHVALAQATDLYETAQKGGTNCVLRVSIAHMLYPVTIDVLHQVRYSFPTTFEMKFVLQIFSKFGTVLKIITFTKNGSIKFHIDIDRCS